MRPMMCLLPGLLLVLPLASAHAAGSLGQVAATEPQTREPSHHPLIEVRYVLISPKRSEPSVPRIELGDGRSELSLPRSNMQATLLDPSRPPPNVFVCPGVHCGW